MATPWEDRVRKTGRLTLFPGSSVTGGAWAGVFTSAITEFNRLAAGNNLGVTLSQASAPPDPNGVGGADVQVEAGNGSVTFSVFGQQTSVAVNGTGLEGNTQQVKLVFGTTQRIAKAFVVVPATPQINAPPRGVGDGVKLVILVHEFVHACGLSNADHNANDLFSGFPQARAGSTPSDDKVEVNQQRRLPPLFLTAQTAGVIRGVW